MSDKWKDKGWTNDSGNQPLVSMLPGGHEHNIQNSETGEWRTIRVDDGQTVGEAIENGQFTDEASR
jgi:hypothetical protein